MTEILKRLLYEESELSETSIKQKFMWLLELPEGRSLLSECEGSQEHEEGSGTRDEDKKMSHGILQKCFPLLL